VALTGAVGFNRSFIQVTGATLVRVQIPQQWSVRHGCWKVVNATAWFLMQWNLKNNHISAV